MILEASLPGIEHPSVFACGHSTPCPWTASSTIDGVDKPTFGEWFKPAIRKAGFRSYREFAERAGVSKSAVGEWANNHRNPDPAYCDIIADVLGVDRDYVLALAGHRPEEPDIPFDDPRARISALVRRVNWNHEREYTIARALNGYIELDRSDR